MKSTFEPCIVGRSSSHLPLLFFLFFLFPLLLGAQGHRVGKGERSPYQSTYQRMAGGNDHTLEIRGGTLWSWGANDFGQLGLGNTSNADSPQQVGMDSNWVSIAGGKSHSLGLKANGSLWAWGLNDSGQVGDGTTTQRNAPVRIGNDSDWVAISAGGTHSMALKANGTLYAWGDNSKGQLGIGVTGKKLTPQRVGTDSNWVSIAGGNWHSLGLRSDGTLWAWGGNSSGQLGDPGVAVNQTTPLQIGTDHQWDDVEAGFVHSMGLRADGTLYAWGGNSYGQLGDGTTSEKESPTKITGADSSWTAIAIGTRYHSAALKADGSLWTWGRNHWGQLGDGTTDNDSIPKQVGTDEDWVAVALGGNHGFALKADGRLQGWGRNFHGQLGDGTTTDRLQPAQIQYSTDSWLVMGGERQQSAAVKTDGKLYTWGGNGEGQLGDGSTDSSLVPIQVGNDQNWVNSASGVYHTLGIRADGTLWGWGQNQFGEVGDGTNTERRTPVRVGNDTDWVQVAAGHKHSLGIRADGTLWAWGYNGSGQIGDGSSSNRSSPVKIGPGPWVQVEGGEFTSYGIKADGTLWAWGDNSYGQLGNGTTTPEDSPVQIGLADDWVSISAMGDHVLALKDDGSLWAWGRNHFGQLGDATNSNRHSPVRIGSSNDWIRIETGVHHSMALKADGSLWVWGWNGEGQLGDHSTVDKSVPNELGNRYNVVELQGGGIHSLIIEGARERFCSTGGNLKGELGKGDLQPDSSYKCHIIPGPLSLSFDSISDVQCHGDSTGAAGVSVSGGVPPYSYSWSPSGDTGNTATGLWKGTHYVEVIDAIGDTITDSVQIDEPPVLALSASAQDLSCAGKDDGMASVSVSGGVQPYSYAWSNGDSSSTLDSLSPGSYQVLVKDDNSCEDSVTVNIGAPPPLTLSFNTQDASCEGIDDGSISVSPGGGTAPYSYQWSNGDTTAQVTGLPEGVYSVLVTDSNGCQVSGNDTIEVSSSLTVNTSVTDADCGQSNGSATVNVSGGNSPYNYVWSTGDTTGTVDSLASGSYTAQITDSNGCEAFASVTVNDSGGVSASLASFDDVSCPGGTDGAVDVDVTGGTSPLSYQWSNGDTTEDLSGIPAGPYQLQVTDADSCESFLQVTVADPPPMKLDFSTVKASCDSSDGEAAVTVTGGTGPYNYMWSAGSDSAVQTGISGGDYSVTVIDSNGCVDSGMVMLSEQSGPSVTINNVQHTSCGTSGGSISIAVSGGSTPYSYDWSNGSTGKDLTGVGPGTYFVKVTDSAGCNGMAQATVEGTSPTQTPICVVSVDSSSEHNLVIWEKPSDPSIASYNIYKESYQAGVYSKIANVKDSALSTYVDSSSDPMIRSYRYKIASVDSCGNVSPLSPKHKTIHLTASEGLNDEVDLIWDDYKGFSYPTFYIYRHTDATGWTKIDSLPASLNSYTDNNAPVDSSLRYMIGVRPPSGVCTATRSKNYNNSISNAGSLTGRGSDDDSDTTQSIKERGGMMDVELYPNPTEGDLTFEWSGGNPRTVDVYDMLGERVLRIGEGRIGTRSKGRLSIDLNGRRSGVYWIRVEGKEKVLLRRGVVVR